MTGIFSASKPSFVAERVEHRNRLLAVRRVVVEERDLLALELVESARLLAEYAIIAAIWSQYVVPSGNTQS